MATVAVPTPTCKTLIADLYGTTEAHDAPATTQAAPLPEAAFSLTLKGTKGGHEAMLTVRGQTAPAFHANVAAVRGVLDAPPAPAPQAQPTPPAPAATEPGWCAVHSVPIQPFRGDCLLELTGERKGCMGLPYNVSASSTLYPQ